MSKYLGDGCGKDIGGIPCGEFIEEGEDSETNMPVGNYYYCDECRKKIEELLK